MKATQWPITTAQIELNTCGTCSICIFYLNFTSLFYSHLHSLLQYPLHTGPDTSKVFHLFSKFERIDIIFYNMSFRSYLTHLATFFHSPLPFCVFYSIPQHAHRPRLVVHTIYPLYAGPRITLWYRFYLAKHFM